jgi:hypothetical protein
MDEKRVMLRHTLATVAYRGGKAIRDAPAGFAECRAAETSRSAGEILAHVGDLYDWALALAKGTPVWHDSKPLTWDLEAARFFSVLAAFDAYIAGERPLAFPAEKLFQGPIADSLTHIGQIAMLRRVAGSPIRGENYFKADISGGHVDSVQPAPRREFD